MADVRSDPDRVPPPAEQLHLPGPSYQPIAVTVGTTIAVVGVVIDPFPFWVVVGLIIAFVAIMLWVRDTRRDMAELPLDHGGSAPHTH
jgi:hypothetical protein